MGARVERDLLAVEAAVSQDALGPEDPPPVEAAAADDPAES
jgi:hypothetical protein